MFRYPCSAKLSTGTSAIHVQVPPEHQPSMFRYLRNISHPCSGTSGTSAIHVQVPPEHQLSMFRYLRNIIHPCSGTCGTSAIHVQVHVWKILQRNIIISCSGPLFSHFSAAEHQLLMFRYNQVNKIYHMNTASSCSDVCNSCLIGHCGRRKSAYGSILK